jgi:hypothetical protein
MINKYEFVLIKALKFLYDVFACLDSNGVEPRGPSRNNTPTQIFQLICVVMCQYFFFIV